MGKRKSTPTSLTMKKAAAADCDQDGSWDMKQEPLVMDFQEPDASDHSPASGGSPSPITENGYGDGRLPVSNGSTNLMETLRAQMLFQQNGVSQSSKNLLDFVITENDGPVSQSPGGSASGDSIAPIMDRHYWSEEETNLLMELYVKNLSRFKERRHTGITIWEEIAAEIKENLGVVVTGDQCHSKLRNMKRTYIRATARGTHPYPPDTTKDQVLVMKGTGGSMQKVTVPAPLAEMFASSLPVNFTNPASFPQSLSNSRYPLSGLDLTPKALPPSTVAASRYASPASFGSTKVIHNRTPSLLRPTSNASTQTTPCKLRRTKTQSLILKTVRRQQIENRIFQERMRRESQEQIGLLLRCVSELTKSVAEIKQALGHP